MSDAATSFLVDALQSPHCRLTDLIVDGESTCDMLGVRCVGKSPINVA